MWGYQAWENDAAADLFAQFVSDTGFVSQVRKTLKSLDASDCLDDELYLARVCAFCLIKFGRVYIWPISELDSDLKLCIKVLNTCILVEDDEKLAEKAREDVLSLENLLNR